MSVPPTPAGPPASSERIAAWLGRAVADEEFRSAARGLDHAVLFICDGDRFLLRIGAEPECADATAAAPAPRADISVSAAADGWAWILSATPPPGWQSFSALLKTNPDVRIEGGELAIAQCLYPLERLFELARGEEGRRAEAAAPARDGALIQGRYRDLPGPGGSQARIFFEEAGQGLPLVMLHTAGADGRQYHDLLSDIDWASRWRMLAFDLPLHGRSFPPSGWAGGPYTLREAEYAAWCVSFIEHVARAPAVVLGCSMGAAIALVLAARYPEWIRAVVALEAPFLARGRRSPFLCHGQVNQAAHNPSYVRGLMSPTSPESRRRLAWWIYSQGGYGIYSGDLHFYSDEFDGGAVAAALDAARCPIYLLTGEYDFSASPRSSQQLADAIPGAVFRTMAGLGHFPMTENPDLLRTYLDPVLTELHGRFRP